MDLRKIILKNYKSYRKAEIIFDKDGLFLVIGRNSEEVDEKDGNGSGKTGFISSVPFALYGRAFGILDKELVNEDVIYKDENDERADKAEVDIKFVHAGKFYRVYRSVTEKGNQKVMLFASPDDKQWADLTLKAGINKRTGKRESGIVRTEQRIADILGSNVDLFINSVYFEQSNIDTFARGTLSEKDNIFKAAIGVDRWSDYARMMSEDFKEIEKDIGVVNTLIDEQGDADKLKDDLKLLKDDIKKIGGDIQQKKGTVDLLRDEEHYLIEDVSKEIAKISQRDNFQEQVVKGMKQISSLQERVDSCEEKITRYKNNTVKEKGEITRATAEYNLIALKYNDDEEKLKNHTKEEENKILEEINVIFSEIGKLEGSIEDNILKGKSIPTMNCPLGIECDSLTPKAKEKYRETLLEEYKFLNAKLGKTKKRHENKLIEKFDIQNDLAMQNNMERMKVQIESLDNLINTQKKNVESMQHDMEEVIDEKNKSVEERDSTRAEVRKLEDDLDSCDTEKLEKVKLDLQKKRDEIENFNGEVEELTKIKIERESEIKRVQEDISKTKGLKEKFGVLQDQRNVVRYSLDMVRKEIPHLLISNAIPEIKEYAKDYIYRLSNGRLDIDFLMDRELKTKSVSGADKASAFDIWVNVDGKWLKYAQTSGGERSRADVAIHLAYVCFMANRSKTRLETLFLDEVGAALDKSGVFNFVECIKELREMYGFKKIFNISQNIEMKKMIDNRLLVTKKNDGSVIEEY